MAKTTSYPRNISIISVIFILLIVFLALINLYVSNQLRIAFINAQEERISSLANFCSSYIKNPDREKIFKMIVESFNIGGMVITDVAGNKLYDSYTKFPGIYSDNTRMLRRLPESEKMVVNQNNIVYHNPDPEFYLYLFGYQRYETINNLFRWHLLYVTISLIFISFLGVFLIRNLFLPMRYVANVAQRYGIEMQREDFVPATFNEIFGKLKNKEKELLEFSAYIAHEFRNSLATITGLARLIQKGKKDPEEIIQECNTMEGLIKGLLEYSKPVKITKNEFELNELLEEAVRKVELPDWITMERDYAFTGTINADYELLLSAIVNLLRNSIEAIAGNGKISLKTMREQDAVLISIFDTGSGITEENIKDIFSPFYSNKKGGTGLGLAFVKKVVELHDGRITVQSMPSKGTEFLIRIPLRI